MRNRAAVRLTANLERNLLAYATVATAAGIGASTVPAEAKVIYTPVQIVLGPVWYYRLDLNNDGTDDFGITQYLLCGSDLCASFVYANPWYPRVGNGVEIKGNSSFAGAMIRGAQIGPRRKYQASSRIALLGFVSGSDSGRTDTRGYWVNAKHRFLGLKLELNGKTHYGWCRISVLRDGPPIYRLKTKISGYAYETQPNKPIVAGDKGTGAKSLGHLAVGAAERKHR